MNEDAIVAKLAKRSRLLGDDCAIIRPRAGEEMLFTTDFTIEGVHFTRVAKPADVGHRALARSLSDIAAMGGTPRYCMVALAAAPWTTQAWIDGFFRGLLALARETKTALAGGDLSHAGQVVCDVMLCGSTPLGASLRRDGARAGDIIYVSGALGGWRHKPTITPRLDVGRKLRGKATACMDISDGLALDLSRMLKASGVSAALEDTIPLLTGATIDDALHAGEDYELLFTAPAGVRVPGIRIGVIAAGKPGTATFRGKRLSTKGYDHFQQSP